MIDAKDIITWLKNNSYNGYDYEIVPIKSSNDKEVLVEIIFFAERKKDKQQYCYITIDEWIGVHPPSPKFFVPDSARLIATHYNAHQPNKQWPTVSGLKISVIKRQTARYVESALIALKYIPLINVQLTDTPVFFIYDKDFDVIGFHETYGVYARIPQGMFKAFEVYIREKHSD